MTATRDTASATVAEPVDGTTRRRRSTTPRRTAPRPRAEHVDPLVWATVQRLAAENPSRRIRIISPSEVRLT